MDEQIGGFQEDLSIFYPFFRHEVKETLEAGGEAYVSKNSDGEKDGLFIYDNYEETGTVFTKSKEVFDYFYRLKPSSYIFSELELEEYPKEVWNVWMIDVDKTPFKHRFKHNVVIDHDVKEIEQFIVATQPGTNRKWIDVALKNGDKCFVVKIGNRIVGIAWLSIVDGIARSHSVYVEPQFRRTGIMSDNLQARLIYLKSMHVHTLINEIAESNVASSGHVAKAGESIVGKIYLYTSPNGEDESK
ncbi:MAG: GNAT family N-acetyltransferase [Nitrososphaerota archaeon]|nr:GNAT family N-acetyltransferase [Nitrososphaerota archaeon]